jgi:HAD superfamily hydrolase (TIGR01509 family)
MKTPEVIFFDLDETLIRNTGEPGASFHKIYHAYPNLLEPANYDAFMAALMTNASQLWQTMFEGDKTGSSQMIAAIATALEQSTGAGHLADEFFEHFVSTARACTKLNPNALLVLDQLRGRGLKAGIITNGIDTLQMAKIDQHRLSNHVDAVIVSEHARAHKPSPEVFRYAMEKIGTTADEAWHVGDHLTNDISGALDTGMVAVHYYQDRSLEDVEAEYLTARIRPHYSIGDLADILNLVESV